MRRIEVALEIFKSNHYLDYLHSAIVSINIAGSMSKVYFTFSDGQQCAVDLDDSSVVFVKNEAYLACNH
jgi:hypothetical protein